MHSAGLDIFRRFGHSFQIVLMGLLSGRAGHTYLHTTPMAGPTHEISSTNRVKESVVRPPSSVCWVDSRFGKIIERHKRVRPRPSSIEMLFITVEEEEEEEECDRFQHGMKQS